MIIRNHISHYEILEELLGFQYFIHNKLADFYQKHSDKDELIKNHFAALSGALLFGYNIQFLQTAFESLEASFIHPTASNLRSVFEGIPKMYYLSLYPERTFPIMIHEIVKESEYKDAIKKLKEEKYQKFLKDKKLPFTNKNNFDKFKKKYKPSWIRRQLYDGAIISDFSTDEFSHVEVLQKFYDKLSDSSHANLMRNETAVDYEPADVELFFGLLKSMSYFNIHAFLEVSTEIVGELGMLKPSVDFLNRIAEKQKTMLNIAYFIPTIPSLGTKLKISTKS